MKAVVFAAVLAVAVAVAPAAAASAQPGSATQSAHHTAVAHPAKRPPHDEPSPRIVGGTPVPDSSTLNLFQVAILDDSVDNDHDACFCGGSLFRDRYVVTAAHCFVNEKTGRQTEFPSQVSVLVGSRTLSRDGTGRRIGVATITIHPQYDYRNFYADVAVLELAESVPDIPSAELPARGSDPRGGSINTVTGWGETQSHPNFPVRLHAVDVKVVPVSTCNSKSLYGGDILKTMYCAAAPGKDSCRGDSGGPATSGDVLIGIVSNGPYPCAQSQRPGVYTRVGSPLVYDFIDATAPL